ncbi:MAG: hypothetical protein JXR94_16945 [Candidatus Hydrogenedentes bacterium]|nr:hypothetical protein [Candidatus Hydrogenedentota bacterium]
MGHNDSEHGHPFAADRPIECCEEDLLGRASLAEAIAESLASWRQRDSLVVALCAPWGAGKSSVKNMVLEKVGQTREPRPLIIDFNPWQRSTRGGLVGPFFQEIGSHLGLDDGSKDGKERARKWSRYAARFKTIATAIEPLSGWSLRILIAIGAISASTTSCVVFGKDKDWTDLWSVIPAAFFLAVLSAPKWLAGVCRDVAESVGLSATAERKTLVQLKRELAESLREREAPLLVVMDDIDRLSTTEIKSLFQLVKANADFPNVVYFLLFQRDIVEKALDDDTSGQGRGYIEKIVQVPFDLPPVERPRLERVLSEGLDRVLAEVGIEEEGFDKDRWGNIYFAGIPTCFETLRDVRRFLSALSFHAPLFRGDRAFEANPVDLIAIEALRVFEPETYSRLRSMKQALTEREEGGAYGDDTSTEEKRRQLELLVEAVSDQNREAVREILRQLFPAAERLLGGPTYGSEFEDRWYRELRVCHPQIFDRYFYLAIPEGDVSQSDIQRIMDLAGDRERLASQFRSLKERGLLAAMLNRLEAYKEKIDIAHAVPFTTAIMDIGDDLPDDDSIFTGPGSVLHAVRIILWYLLQEPDPAKRATSLSQAIQATEGLYLPVRMIASECDSEGRRKAPSICLVEADQLPGLKGLGREKLEEAARKGTLRENARLESLLWQWAECGRIEEVRAWLNELVASQEGALIILSRFMRRVLSHQMDDHVARERWKANLEGLEHFLPFEEIERMVDAVTEGSLSPEEARAVSAFKTAIMRRKAGKPYGLDRFQEDD